MRLWTDGSTRRDFFTVGVDFDSLSFDQQIKSLIIGDDYAESYVSYYKQLLGWALSGYPLVIKYEELVGSSGGCDDTVKINAIKRIAKHLCIHLTREHLAYVFDNLYYNKIPYAGAHVPVDGLDIMDGKVYKRASTGQWSKFLNEENKQLLKDAIGDDLIRLGYEQDLNW